MKSFLVIGMGCFGVAVARKFAELGHEVLVVDRDEDAIAHIADEVTHAVVGDATDEAVLRSIGARNFDCAIVAIASDIQNSILITMLLKEAGVSYVVSKASSALHLRVLKRTGADKIVFPEMEMGVRLAQSLSTNNVEDYIGISEDFLIAEIHPPVSWVGKTLKQLDVRARYGVNVLAIRGKEEKEINVNPSPDQVISGTDMLVMIGTNDDMARIGELK